MFHNPGAADDLRGRNRGGRIAGWPSVRRVRGASNVGPSIFRFAYSFPASRLDDVVSLQELLQANMGGTGYIIYTTLFA